MSRAERLQNMVEIIRHEYGEGAITCAGNLKEPAADVISTGFPELDDALGIGGIPIGRVTEIYGDTASGKTYIALSIAKQAQKKGAVLYIDADKGLSPYMIQNAGIDPELFYTVHVDSMEDTLKICSVAGLNKVFSCIIIDTITALCPNNDIRCKMGEYMAKSSQAAIMDKFLRVITKFGCTIVILSQVRGNVGITLGNSEKPARGKALGYYATVRIDTRRIQYKPGITTIWTEIKKNKCANPMKRATFCLSF